MRKLFIAFSLLSLLATPAFADSLSSNLSISADNYSKGPLVRADAMRYGRDLTRGMIGGVNAGGMAGNVSGSDLDRDIGGRANGGQAGGAKGGIH